MRERRREKPSISNNFVESWIASCCAWAKTFMAAGKAGAVQDLPEGDLGVGRLSQSH
jgi:hypothetical protein